MTFTLSKIGILKIPWLPFIILSLIFFAWSLYQLKLQGILLSLVALILFSAFWSFAGKSYVKLAEQELEVKYAHVAQFRIPYQMISSAEAVEHPFYYGLGIRCVRKGVYALVADTQGVIEFVFKEPIPIRINLVSITLQAEGLRLSLEEAENFIGQLRTHLEEGNGGS